MAVDKKSEHYTPPQNYRDLDGNMKTFTNIDCDKKLKISLNVDKADKNSENEYREGLYQRILGIPAVYCPVEFSDFILRGQDRTAIGWDEKMIRDNGLGTHRLVQLVTLLENRKDNERLTL